MEILKEYRIGPVKVKIVKDKNNICKYLVIEPKLKESEKIIVEEVVGQLLYTTNKNVEDEIIKRVKERGLSDEAVEKVLYNIKKQLLYDIITPLMSDPDVEEIECRGYGYPITVVHRQFGECIRLFTNLVPETEDQVVRIIERLATRGNKAINIAKPYLEFALPEGHRVAATVSKEISLPGSTFDVRKFPTKPLSITAIIQKGALNEFVAAYLWFIMEYKPFILILGPTGAGKTTLLNALLNMVNPNYKILTIEDTAELNVQSDNWVRFIGRSTLASDLDVTLNDLARLSLRYRPDYLVIGEVRGKEIEALIHAAASGHASLSTFHGAKPHDAVTRISSLLSPELSKLFIKTITSFIVTGNRREGNKNIRSILAIYEVTDNDEEPYEKVIEWDFKNKTFTPTDFDSLIEKSYRLKLIAESYGLSTDDIKNELEKRANFLRKLINENIIDIVDVSREVRKFYSSGEENVEKETEEAKV